MASRWRPQNHRQILQIDNQGNQGSAVETVAASNNPILTNVSSANKLHALLGHYNSDDDDESENDDPEFNSFLEEIKTVDNPPSLPSTSWQELWDPQSGQPYYWNTLTNELTWVKPSELINPPFSKQTDGENETVSQSLNRNPVEQNEVASAPLEPALDSAGQKHNKLPMRESYLGPQSFSTVASISSTGNQKESQLRKEDTKISFKLVQPEKSAKNGDVPKMNGQNWNAESIIAAIEKEIPPDYKQETFVPLFKRRTFDTSKPKLGNNFKNFFRPIQSVLDLEPDASLQTLPTNQSTYRGLGYEETEDKNEEQVKPQQSLQFVAGEVLKPLKPTIPLTLDERIKRLESQSNADNKVEFSKQKVLAQLEVLKDAWRKKKLDSSFLDEWLTAIETLPKEEFKDVNARDQVVDMVLEDTDNEDSELAKNISPSMPNGTAASCPEALDSELTSFYSDLASLDSTSQPAPIATTLIVNNSESDVNMPLIEQPPKSEEESMVSDPVKGIKRSKMSSDMTSLVAKWQKIQQQNT